MAFDKLNKTEGPFFKYIRSIDEICSLIIKHMSKIVSFSLVVNSLSWFLKNLTDYWAVNYKLKT